jgi:flagellar basal-body rod modification protein FlgD
MITQMKNQDPTAPFKAEQMAAEMAQFTTVEQLKNMNESLTKMSTANQPLERMAMTGMIGKSVTVDRGRFPHTEGTNDSVSFGLSKDAAKVTVSLVDEHGETILSKDMGSLKAGENSFGWDGKKTNSLPARSGNYMIRVEATDEQGQRIESDSVASARVIGVSFEGSEPVFLIGDNQHQEKVTMKNIVRIDDTGPAPALGGAPAQNPGIVSASAGGRPKAAPSFFTYQKGVGSSNIDSAAAAPEVQRAIAEYKSGLSQAPSRPVASAQGVGAPGSQAAPAPQAERGFPNGLHDDEEAARPASLSKNPQTGDTLKGGDKK